MTRHPDAPKHKFDPYTMFVILVSIALLLGTMAVMWSIDHASTQLPTL